MNGRVVRGGVVAGLFVAMTAAYFFNTTRTQTIRFPEIAEAMGEARWTHASVTGCALSMMAPGELWSGRDEKILARKMSDGQVSFCSLEELQVAEYDPNSKTITYCHVRETESSLRWLSPLLMIGNMQQLLQECRGKTTAHMGRYQGQRVQVQQTSLSTPGKRVRRYVMRLYVDPKSRLLQAAEVTAYDARGGVVTAGQIVFEYPSTGPRDIYDLGIPLETRIVNDIPADDYGFQMVYPEQNNY